VDKCGPSTPAYRSARQLAQQPPKGSAVQADQNTLPAVDNSGIQGAGHSMAISSLIGKTPSKQALIRKQARRITAQACG
jgi:hypothetical protein